jgi:hypothetical protein
MGEDPREGWILRFLERTRTPEAKAGTKFRMVLSSYTAGQLEIEHQRAVLEQQDMVRRCGAANGDPELRTNFLAYIEKYPGIKGIVGLEDTTVGWLAVAANAVSPPVGVANPTPERISTLPSILPWPREWRFM